MDATTQGLYPRRRATGRQWLMLGAAVAAVLVMVVLIAVACRSTPPAVAGLEAASPSAGPPDETGSTDPEGTDSHSSGGEEAADGDSNGGGGSGDNGNGGGGGGEDEGDDGPHDTWQPLTSLQVVEERHPVAANDYLRTGVHCPEGKVALGGGFRSVGPATWGDPVYLQESSPGTVGAGNAISLWLFSVQSTSAIARFVDLYAVCADPPPGYEVRRTDAELNPAGTVTQGASCEPAAAVLGGGVQVVGAGSANFSTIIRASAPAGSGWQVAVDNHGPFSRTGGFKVVCSVLPAGYQVVSGNLSMGPGESGTGSASCPAGTVIGGGVAPVDGNSGHYLRQSYPDGGSWVVTVDNVTPLFGQRVFQVWVICAQAS